MYAIATSLITVYRGTETDEFGDPKDTQTIAASGVPASIVEQTRTAYTASDPTPRVIHYTIGRVSAGTDIRDEDRVYDQTSGFTYIVQSVSPMLNPVLAMDLRLDLKRIA